MIGNPDTSQPSLMDTLKELEAKLDRTSKTTETTTTDTTQKTESKTEAPALPEKRTDQAFEDYKQVNEDKPAESPYVIKQASHSTTTPAAITDQKSKMVIEIEELMAQGLGDQYQRMTPEEQAEFRKVGEETASTISQLIDQFKLTAKKGLQLIRRWLRIIPGVNKFFLEQEAKIKADEIIKYARERAHKS